MTDRTTAFGLALLAQEQKINESSYYPTMSEYQKAQLMYEQEWNMALIRSYATPISQTPTTKGMWSSLTNAYSATYIGGTDPIELGIPQEKKLLLLI